MSRDQWNWLRTTVGTYTLEARGFAATITINADGSATLAIVGTGAPAAATYATRGQAKAAFSTFLQTQPVA